MNVIKKFLLSVVLIVILTSCEENQTANSIWIESYSIQNDSIMVWPSGQSILDLEGDKAIMVTFYDAYYYHRMYPTKFDTLHYNQQSQTFQIDSFTLPIEIEKDTLKVNYGRRKVIYVKLKEEWKTEDNINFIGEYEFKNPVHTYHYEFLNDSLLNQFVVGQEDEKYPFRKWEVVSYKGYQFFVVHEFGYVLSIILGGDSNHIDFRWPIDTLIPESATKVESNSTTLNLEGDWIADERIGVYDKNLFPNYDTVINPINPPGPGYIPDSLLSNFNIKIKADSIIVNRYGRSIKSTWSLSRNKKRLLLLGKKNEAWEVLNYKDSVFTLRMNSRTAEFAKDIITFKKMN